VPTQPRTQASAADVAAVADTFVNLMRSFVRARARLLAAAAHDVEWSAQVVLNSLAMAGPIRMSELADRIESDLSTVSRQASALVKDGLIERRPDPVDGRACLLAPTAKGEDVLREHHELRTEHFGRMLGTWSDDDLHAFASLLERFTHDFENADHNWLSERAASARVAAGGKN